jgi:hypothetical protein
MAIGPVGPFRIEIESDADEYLKDLLSHPEYRSMSEVRSRAQALIEHQELRDYFVSAAKAILEWPHKRNVQGFAIAWSGDRILQVKRLSAPQHGYEFITSPDKTHLEKLYSTSPVDVATNDPLVDAQRFEDEARKAAREYLRLQGGRP